MVVVCLLQLLGVQSHSTLAHPKIMENMKDIKIRDYNTANLISHGLSTIDHYRPSR